MRAALEVAKADCVLVASCYHTGTWFSLDFLTGLDGLDGVTEFSEIVSGQAKANPRMVVHFHLVGSAINSKGGRVVGYSFEDACYLMERVRTLVPLRDPLKALITREARHPAEDHHFIVDAFMYMQRLPPTCVLFPVDIPESYDDRLAALLRVANVLGLDGLEHITNYAMDWPNPNSRGNHALKILYEKHQDLESVSSFFFPEYKYLLEHAEQIIPFLISAGYKDLPWWAEARK